MLWLAPFERGEPKLELVNPVSQDLQLSLVGEAPFRCPAEPGRCLRPCRGNRERDEPLRPVRPVDQPGRDLTGPVPVAQRGAGCARVRRRTLERDPVRPGEPGGQFELKLPLIEPVIPVHDA